MYTNDQFTLTSDEDAVAFVRRHQLGVLATTLDGRVVTSPLPMDLRGTAETGYFVAGHVARANEQWHAFEHGPHATATFLGSDTYVPAEWFGDGVRSRIPTWLYGAVEVSGRLELSDPERTRADVEVFMDRLQQETVEGSTWTLDEIPAHLTSTYLTGIVGFRVHDLTFTTCFRLNQRKSAEHRAALADALETSDTSARRELAGMVRRPPTEAGCPLGAATDGQGT